MADDDLDDLFEDTFGSEEETEDETEKETKEKEETEETEETEEEKENESIEEEETEEKNEIEETEETEETEEKVEEKTDENEEELSDLDELAEETDEEEVTESKSDEKETEETEESEKIKSEEFEIEGAKEVYTIYGKKGEGKTVQALSFPGDIVALSFDRKTEIIKENVYNGDDRIRIFDMQKTLDYGDQDAWPRSAQETVERLLEVLDDIEEENPDWVLIDGFLQLTETAEQAMRYRHDLGPFEGVSNLNIWKERKMIIRQVHKRAYDIAEKGVIYTTYTDHDKIVREGELIAKEEVPNWIDILTFETDYVLKVEYDDIEKSHKVHVDTSKNDEKLGTGRTYDVSDFKSIWEVTQ